MLKKALIAFTATAALVAVPTAAEARHRSVVTYGVGYGSPYGGYGSGYGPRYGSYGSGYGGYGSYYGGGYGNYGSYGSPYGGGGRSLIGNAPSCPRPRASTRSAAKVPVPRRRIPAAGHTSLSRPATQRVPASN